MCIKRILFICSIFKPNIGGVETSISELARVLRHEKIETTVLTKRFPHQLQETEIIDNIGIIRFNRPQSQTDFDAFCDWILKNDMSLKSDLIHVIGVRRPMPLIALFLSKLWRVPLLVTFSGGDLPEPNDDNSKTLWEEGIPTVIEAVKQADAWSAYSKYTAKLAKKVIPGIGSAPIIYGGINLDEIKKAKIHKQKHPYFFTARRLEYVKGTDILINAFAKVSARFPAYELIIAGDGSYENKLKEQTQRLGLNSRIKFAGALNQSSVFSYMKGAVAHICPSRAESGGLVNYEAQAAGCISIASNAGGIPEYIIDGKTGLLFKNENTNDLAKKMMSVIKNKAVADKIRKQAAIDSKNHSWEKFGELYCKLYESIISGYVYKPLNPWSTITKRLSNKIKINDN